jgi:hypothetical protein
MGAEITMAARMVFSRCPILSRHNISATPGEQQSNPTTHRPRKQPGEPVPVRPALAPVGNSRGDAHYFSDNKEPQHMPRRLAWSKARADPRTKNRDHNEARRARHERIVGGHAATDEIAREQAREQRVRAKNQNN